MTIIFCCCCCCLPLQALPKVRGHFRRVGVRENRVIARVASPNDCTISEMAAKVGLSIGAAALLTVVPPCWDGVKPALAVSGGGGMSTSMAFKDFSGQDLRKSKYTKADLRGADFSGANLEGVPMFGAICVDTKFVGANLRGADLESADLEGADLSNAVLEGAMLTNTQFRLIKSIEGADFTDALIRKDIMMGLCKIASGTNPTTGVETRESLNCP